MLKTFLNISIPILLKSEQVLHKLYEKSSNQQYDPIMNKKQNSLKINSEFRYK